MASSLSPDEGPEPAATGMAESEEQIRREIEAIRRQIAENEQLLGQENAAPAEPRVDQPGRPPSQARVPVGVDTPEAGYGYYVYGVAANNGYQPIEELSLAGIDPAFPVWGLPHRSLQAVVSRVSLQEFGQEALEANLEDLHWLEAKVRVHEEILDAVSSDRSLVPTRFGTIYREEASVRAMLDRHGARLAAALAQLEDKQEWGVKLYCDAGCLAETVGQVSDRVRELQAEIAAKSEGVAYFVKKKLERMVAEEVERVSNDVAQCSHDRLACRADETVTNRIQGKELTGRTEAMVLNDAYLVAKDRLAAFGAEVDSLMEEYGDLGFSYEVTGPWPPYNFAAIDLAESDTGSLQGGDANE
jgi:hypothetical protein